MSDKKAKVPKSSSSKSFKSFRLRGSYGRDELVISDISNYSGGPFLDNCYEIGFHGSQKDGMQAVHSVLLNKYELDELIDRLRELLRGSSK